VKLRVSGGSELGKGSSDMGPAQRLDAAMGMVKRGSQHVKLTAPLWMEPSGGGSSDMGPAVGHGPDRRPTMIE
jgi:hypothetical protein